MAPTTDVTITLVEGFTIAPSLRLPRANGGGAGSVTYTVSSTADGVTGELPDGLEFDQTRLLLHGTPEAAGGPHTVTYTATNSQGDFWFRYGDPGVYDYHQMMT